MWSWRKRRFEFDAALRKSSFIPKDKFKTMNWLKYFEYRMYVDYFSDHTIFYFLDEKHIHNHNGHDLRVRINPFMGEIDGIPVSGNFRDSYTITACISTNPNKDKHVYYKINKKLNTSKSFMEVIGEMVDQRFLLHHEILIMDNAAIYVGGEAKTLEDYLWNTHVDGKPLKVLVLFLPPCAPELNPIELIFNMLVQRLKSFHYRRMEGVSDSVMKRVEKVLNNIKYETIVRCYMHCGYLK